MPRNQAWLLAGIIVMSPSLAIASVEPRGVGPVGDPLPVIPGWNADYLDGLDSAQFLRSDEDGTLLGDLVVSGRLEVGGPAAPSTPLRVKSVLGNTRPTIHLDNADGGYLARLSRAGTNFGLAMDERTLNVRQYADDGTVLRELASFGASGHAGIGTATPGLGTGDLALTIDSSPVSGQDTAALELKGENINNGQIFAAVGFYNAQAGNTRVAQIAAARGAVQDDGELRFFTSRLGTEHERMRITQDGNVGIGGGTEPTARLDVAGNLDFDGQKACVGHLAGSVDVPMLVPASWTVNTCEAWAIALGAHQVREACIFETGFSITAPSSGPPSPNCGW